LAEEAVLGVPTSRERWADIVRLRRRYVLLVALLGVATAVLPAIASSETSPTVEAAGGGYAYPFYWNPSTAIVNAGGAVMFKNMSTTVEHGVVWTGGPETPSCPGVSVNKGETNWKGTCTFTHPGTYTFHCYVHPTEMTGSITVNASGTTTTTTTTPTTTTTTTTTPTTPIEPTSGSPIVGRPSLRSSQRGGSIKGSLDISKTGAGDRLEVDVFAKNASLAKAKHFGSVRVGRFVRSSVSAGKVPFVVKLNVKARNALKRHRRLALSVKIVLTPFYGEALTVTRTVVEHA
jgi:plastocyanin